VISAQQWLVEEHSSGKVVRWIYTKVYYVWQIERPYSLGCFKAEIPRQLALSMRWGGGVL
jgi:hypothetical protein